MVATYRLRESGLEALLTDEKTKAQESCQDPTQLVRSMVKAQPCLLAMKGYVLFSIKKIGFYLCFCFPLG